VLENGGDEKQLYDHAVEVLAKYPRGRCTAILLPDKPLFDYDQAALVAEIDLLTEWFLPLALGRKATDDEIANTSALWRAVLAGIAGSRRVFVHATNTRKICCGLPRDAIGDRPRRPDRFPGCGLREARPMT